VTNIILCIVPVSYDWLANTTDRLDNLAGQMSGFGVAISHQM
jgi:hypothetical protein